MVTQRFNSTNPRTSSERIERAFRKVMHLERKRSVEVRAFWDWTGDGGSWWVRLDRMTDDPEEIYSVNDAEGNSEWISDGFCFEQV